MSHAKGGLDVAFGGVGGGGGGDVSPRSQVRKGFLRSGVVAVFLCRVDFVFGRGGRGVCGAPERWRKSKGVGKC